MQGLKERINQSQELLHKIQQRRQEVQAKASEAQTARVKRQTQQRLETNSWRIRLVLILVALMI